MPQQMYRSIRKRSELTLFGLPLWEIAIGADPAKNEFRGCARGIIAIGDIATGWIAVGGIATGGFALGGVSIGIFSIGGLTMGGIALGGTAIGIVAMGGCAMGYYACGGGAFGKYVLSAAQRSQEAVDFFKPWLPFLQLK